MALKILITGGSIAGTGLAWFLSRAGHAVTLLERAPAFRDGGQNVDLRGVGRAVIRRMGLEEAVRQRGTGETGIAFVDAANRVQAQIDRGAFGGDGPTAELEILRGDLARLLHEAGRERYETLYGDSIAGLEERPEAVEVRFEAGAPRRFDLVLVAEGIGATTRGLVFPDRVGRRPLGLSMGWFTIPRAATDSTVARWFNAPGGRSAFLRPDTTGTTRALLTLRQPPDGTETLSPDRQKALLRDRFADAGWELPRILEGMAAAGDFYFEAIGQIRMPRWSQGRVALTGDAAWCASPISGMGTSLALAGAYVLAGEINRAAEAGAGHGAAFAAYEAILRPVVAQAQKVPRFGPRIAQPSTRLGIGLQRAVIRLMTPPAALAIGRRFAAPAPADSGLPSYEGSGVTEQPRRPVPPTPA